jgi:hypothetical protein
MWGKASRLYCFLDVICSEVEIAGYTNSFFFFLFFFFFFFCVNNFNEWIDSLVGFLGMTECENVCEWYRRELKVNRRCQDDSHDWFCLSFDNCEKSGTVSTLIVTG